MLTKQSGTACVFPMIQFTYVDGGWTDDSEPCHTGECVRRGSRIGESLRQIPFECLL